MRGSKQAFGTKMGFGELDVGEGGDAGATSPRLRKHTCDGIEESRVEAEACSPWQAQWGGWPPEEEDVQEKQEEVSLS